MVWHCRFMSAGAVPKSTQKVVHRVVIAGLADSMPDIPPNHDLRPRRPTANGNMLRRGAATDFMEQVGDALAAPRVASVACERSPCWWTEKDVRTKMQVSQVRGAKKDAQ